MNTDAKRLIEGILPLDRLNEVAPKEKLHPRSYVTLIHYWPARRPTTACRAAIYSALVPCPTTVPARREEAAFVSELASYAPDPAILEKARKNVRLHAGRGGNPPKVLDMFAGGGAIPLEAARLGCESHALDYNPVAHLIELCTLQYPQKFGDSLADDLKTWGGRILDGLKKDVQDLYLPVRISDTTMLPELCTGSGDLASRGVEPVAYIWTRTVPCRRPGCGAQVPLVRRSRLRGGGRRVSSVPAIGDDRELRWDIVSDSAGRTTVREKQARQEHAICVACGTTAPPSYVKEASKAGRMSEALAAVVVPGERSKQYVPPDTATLPSNDECASRLGVLLNETGIPPLTERMNTADATTVAGRGYGISHWSQLFTPRQLLVLFTLVKHIRLSHAAMTDAGMDAERARALTTYLAMAFGRFVNCFNKFTRWAPKDQITMAAIGDRQALKMVNDFSEINCLAETQGCISFALKREEFCIRKLAKVGRPATVVRGNAEKLPYASETFDAVITDPPYYNSIYYAELSGFFYVWLKRIVGDLYPEHFALSTPPKRREAVAQPSEHGKDAGAANEHYLDVMRRSFAEAKRVLKPGAPLVCIYAHKTTAGWSTLIRALVEAGFTVTEAWPVQTESPGRVNIQDAAALSSSIFFVARRRQGTSRGSYETDVEPELHRIVQERVVSLWDGGSGIGGANLLMAAVGAGLRAYTKFSSVQYANGESMPTESYIREVERVTLDTILDKIFGLRGSAVASVDPVSRFYILWRFTFRESSVDAGNVYVFCYPQGIEIDGHSDITGPVPSLVEKTGKKFRVRSYDERGADKRLGMRSGDRQAPIIDSLHRLLWLVENRPDDIGDFLKASEPNMDHLRLVAQALCKPVLGRATDSDGAAGRETALLSRLMANWRNVVDGAVMGGSTKRRKKGQFTMSMFIEGDR